MLQLTPTPRQHRPEDPGMYGVQTWSAGEIYPAIIHVEETYTKYAYLVAEARFNTLDERLISKFFVLTLPGQKPQHFDNRGAAESAAVRQMVRVPS